MWMPASRFLQRTGNLDNMAARRDLQTELEAGVAALLEKQAAQAAGAEAAALRQVKARLKQVEAGLHAQRANVSTEQADNTAQLVRHACACHSAVSEARRKAFVPHVFISSL